MKRTKRNLVRAAIACAAILMVGGLWFRARLAPTPAGSDFYVRWEKQTALHVALSRLADRGVVRDAGALALYAKFRHNTAPIAVGTYRFHPGMRADDILDALRTPVRQMVRLPIHWIADTAKVLEQNDVASAADYVALTKHPQDFQRYVSFHLPKTGSLEGYLYPDTYDLPPLFGAKNTIIRQLQTFEKKVLHGKREPKDMNRILTVASIVQMEVSRPDERAVVAGVIENRLRIGMKLQIDATCLYANQQWKQPNHADLVRTDSPYNTYENYGLPPGPICSPTAECVEAAMHPAKHSYLYYVALPGPERRSLFASTLAEHAANIRKRKAALKGHRS